MNQSAILALIIVLLSVVIVSGTDNICDNSPCESQINASLGEVFAISLESNPSTGFGWWTKFDPNYLGLMSSTFVSGNELSGMVGVLGKQEFTFSAKSAGNTDVIMLLLQPWENGTIAERKIFPINIIFAAAAPRQPIALGKGTNPYESLEGLTAQMIYGTSSSLFKNESVMETPTQAMPQYPSPSSRYEFSSLSQKSTY
jgi:predicted secreted protein